MKAKQHALHFGFAFLALAGVTLLIENIAAVLLRRFFPAALDTDAYIWLLSLLPLYAVALPVCLLLLRPCPPTPPPKKPLRSEHFLLAIVFALGLSYLGNLISNLLLLALSALTGRTFVNPLQELVLGSDPLWSAFAAVIVAPIGEEFLFRRLILDRTRRYGELPALLLSAAMFGLFHMNIYQIFYAFLIGLVLGYLYLRTGQLRFCIALHAAFNFIGSVISAALLRKLTPLLDEYAAGIMPDAETLFAAMPALSALLGMTLIQLFCAGATILLAILLRRRLQLAPGEGARPLWCSPTVLAFLTLCLLMAVLAL